MGTTCYAMVRGSSIRVTGLDRRGDPGTPATFATSKSVATVRINEVTDSASDEVVKSPEEERRLRFTRPAKTIRSTVDINFLRVDPGVLGLISGVSLVYGAVAGDSGGGGVEYGFGEGPFDGGAFGEVWSEGAPSSLGFGGGAFGEDPFGTDVGGGRFVGFDATTRARPTSFALEVWSKLDANAARPAPLGFDELPFDDYPFDVGVDGRGCREGRRWGYTLFQHLRGGRISGFAFAGGLVSFNLVGAQSRRSSGWGAGPYDLEGGLEKMASRVSRNNAFRQMITSAAPPEQVDGIQTYYDVVSNGDAANSMPDPDAPLVLSGGGAVTSPYIISGGRA